MARPPNHPLFVRLPVPGLVGRDPKGFFGYSEVNLSLPAKRAYHFPGETKTLDIWQMCIRAADTLKFVDSKGRPNPDHFLAFAAAFIPPNQWLLREMLAADPGRGGDDCIQRRTAIWSSLRDDLRRIGPKVGVRRGTLVRASLAWLLDELAKYVANPRRKSKRKEFFERFTSGPYQKLYDFPTPEEFWEIWLADNAGAIDEENRQFVYEELRPRIMSLAGIEWWRFKGDELMTWPVNTGHHVMGKKLELGSWYRYCPC